MNRIMTNGGDDDDDVRGELVNGNEVQEWETCSGVEGEQVVVQGSELVSQQDEVQELENGGAFIFYVGFGGLLYFLFKICIGGGFGVAMSVFF